jgi:hypothetical protein
MQQAGGYLLLAVYLDAVLNNKHTGILSWLRPLGTWLPLRWQV